MVGIPLLTLERKEEPTHMGVLQKVLCEVCCNLSPQMKRQIDEDLLLVNLLVPHMNICTTSEHPYQDSSSNSRPHRRHCQA